MTLVPFGTRLKDLRTEKGLSQKELADLSRVSQNAISQWEAGIREPSWSNVQSLAAALGVTCEAFNMSGESLKEEVPAGSERALGKRK